jgi:hypothetical protein
VSNRQRRAAKKHRQRQRERTERSASGDERHVVVELVYAAADAIRAGDAAEALELVAMLEHAPPALVGPVLDGAIVQQRAALHRHGWTDGDCDEVERRRLKVPAGASEVERAVRWLALLCDLPALPSVAPPRAAPSDDDGMLAKIRALLAKAESTTFPHEAEALSAKAQELMARHRIDHVVLGEAASSDGPVGRRIWLDDPYADAKSQLLHTVARAHRCQSIQMGSIGVCHVVGFGVDLDVVEMLHTSLLVQATTALAAAGPQRDARGRSRTRSFRQSFLVAYATRIGRRLLDVAAATETDAVDDARAAGVDLLPVLARRDDEVESAVRTAFPHLRSKAVSVTNRAGWAAGTAAADVADLSVGERLDR